MRRGGWSSQEDRQAGQRDARSASHQTCGHAPGWDFSAPSWPSPVVCRGLECGMSSTREERARRRRATWSGELRDSQSPAQLSTPGERLLSMWTLALDAFGNDAEVPYERSTMPGRLVRSQ